MKVSELIEKLQKIDQNAVIVQWAPDEVHIEEGNPDISLVQISKECAYGLLHIEKFDHSEYNAILFE